MPETDRALALLFADIADAFGLSRPAGQCFAAIWRAAQPPCADDLVAGLGLARSNVSTALKDLRGAGLVSVARTPGDRKEYFTAPVDPWELLRLLAAHRQRSLILPLLDRLMQAEAVTPDSRLAALHDTLSTASAAMAGLAGLDAVGFAKRIGALADPSEKPKKKKKKR
ncbi:MAG: MarR family transcriptional regulator [Paracoccaceae bacterium]